MVIDKIIETLLQRDKYKHDPIAVPSQYAQNKQHIHVLTNKKNEKKYIEKGYKPNFDHKIMTSMMAAYEFVGYYVANNILKDYKLEGFSIPKVKGLTVNAGNLKLIVDKAPGKSVAQHLVKGKNWEDREERHMVAVERYNAVGLPLFDLLGHIDTHEGNTVVSKSGKINFIDFEGAFGSSHNIDETIITMMARSYHSEYAKKLDKILISKFFKNLFKLKHISDDVVFMYVQEAIDEIDKSLVHENFNRQNLKMKLENIFLKGNERSIIHENILHIKEMVKIAEQAIKDNNINLEEAMKFPSDKYTTSRLGEVKRGYQPVNSETIRKVYNKKNKKMYVRKAYSDSFFDESVAAVFEYAAYRAIKEVNRETTLSMRIPRFFALNLNDKTSRFELLTSVDFANARPLVNLKTKLKKLNDFLDNQLIPVTPILLLLGHFDVHGGNIVMSKTDYYMIDFERAFTNTVKKQDNVREDSFKYMQRTFLEPLHKSIVNFYNKDYKTHFKRDIIIKFVKSVNSLDINHTAIQIYSSIEKTERYATTLINKAEISENKKASLKKKLSDEMAQVKNSINDNYKYLENYVQTIKLMPNFKRILEENNKVKEQYEKIIRTRTGETPKTH
jgi:thiamine kinase-like enzyme